VLFFFAFFFFFFFPTFFSTKNLPPNTQYSRDRTGDDAQWMTIHTVAVTALLILFRIHHAVYSLERASVEEAKLTARAHVLGDMAERAARGEDVSSQPQSAPSGVVASTGTSMSEIGTSTETGTDGAATGTANASTGTGLSRRKRRQQSSQ
jgi:hypothetical protein